MQTIYAADFAYLGYSRDPRPLRAHQWPSGPIRGQSKAGTAWRLLEVARRAWSVEELVTCSNAVRSAHRRVVAALPVLDPRSGGEGPGRRSAPARARPWRAATARLGDVEWYGAGLPARPARGRVAGGGDSGPGLPVTRTGALAPQAAEVAACAVAGNQGSTGRGPGHARGRSVVAACVPGIIATAASVAQAARWHPDRALGFPDLLLPSRQCETDTWHWRRHCMTRISGE